MRLVESRAPVALPVFVRADVVESRALAFGLLRQRRHSSLKFRSLDSLHFRLDLASVLLETWPRMPMVEQRILKIHDEEVAQ